MGQEHIEEYLGAIYRLRESTLEPLPLGRVQEYFGFSPISIHEMVQKLEGLELIHYLPYRGVVLTPKGDAIAASLVRRHRIWERFLTDFLDLPWDAAHEYAGQLEHAAPELVTERLANLLGKPESCPHGVKIPLAGTSAQPEDALEPYCRLSESAPGRSYQVCYISPEIPEYLKRLREWKIQPGTTIQLIQNNPSGHTIKMNDCLIEIPGALAQTIRVIEVAA
jgi:DtxR family transcriptional regulator, Mn-dependent transcriptional regulator